MNKLIMILALALVGTAAMADEPHPYNHEQDGVCESYETDEDCYRDNDGDGYPDNEDNVDSVNEEDSGRDSGDEYH